MIEEQHWDLDVDYYSDSWWPKFRFPRTHSILILCNIFIMKMIFYTE
jgi:hypothetical protein